MQITYLQNLWYILCRRCEERKRRRNPGNRSGLVRFAGAKGVRFARKDGIWKKYQKTITIILISFILLPITGCSSTTKSTPDAIITDKSTLEALASDPKKKTKINNIRIQALRDTALSVGARGGLASRANEINQFLLGYENYLSRVFNFYGMLLDNNVLPPVLVEARKTLSLTGNDIIRIADRNYQILHQAKFVTSPPTWRDYLWMDYHSPETPDKSLLPKNTAEQAIWSKYIDEGWEAGIVQASSIFQENINRLKRDYDGMIRYRRLLAQNMVSAPYVATLDLGITGDGSNLTVNDRVLRITAFPSLQADGSVWKTEITPHE